MKLSIVLVSSALAVAKFARGQAGLQWFGANESGAEFGEGTLPVELGKEYYWPNPDAIDLLIGDGMNLFRIPFRIERLSPDTVDGKFAPKYLEDLIATVNHITEQGAWAAIDPHNYGRYYDNILVPEEFQVFWANLAKHFVDNDYEVVLQLNQAAIDGIRSAGATFQFIFVEGNAWTGAWTWVDQNDGMKTLSDPEDKIIFEMHQYFNADGSGSQTCVSPTIGQERLVTATDWLRTNGKLGIIGEFSGYADETCQAAVENMVKYLAENSDVWTGALWWAAGPWWGNSIYSYEPPTGPAYTLYKPILEPYFPVKNPTNLTR
ncbi:hypothetical protein V500_01928 [Pseudogymnoascus sp. VKM F-4518 (FW-2643)]|nr:hypothetical protein V500_01928 [Pseudogymnoascus sp. VKM F-4518 (FW-2643)]